MLPSLKPYCIRPYPFGAAEQHKPICVSRFTASCCPNSLRNAAATPIGMLLEKDGFRGGT